MNMDEMTTSQKNAFRYYKRRAGESYDAEAQQNEFPTNIDRHEYMIGYIDMCHGVSEPPNGGWAFESYMWGQGDAQHDIMSGETQIQTEISPQLPIEPIERAPRAKRGGLIHSHKSKWF